MTFLAPIMLAGLAALSIPAALHLMNRFRVKNTDWAAMRFLEVSLKRSQSRVRLEDILLLLVRLALVAAAVILFAKPAMELLAPAGSAHSGPVAAVILLDDSASMAQSTGAENRFDQAKTAIRDWLDKNEGQSMAALYLVSNRTRSLAPKPERNFSLIRGLLDEAQVTDRSTELIQGIRLACESLRDVTGIAREVHVYTDGQADGWKLTEELKRLTTANPGIVIRPMVIGGDQPADNLGIASLKAEGGMPAAKQICRFQVEVANYGSSPAKDVKVSLSLDGGPSVTEGTIPEINPGGIQAIGLTLTFPDAGPHSVTASIPADALPADNQRVAAIEVARQMNVLIVEEDHAGPPMDRDGYFLANALIPTPRETASRYYLGADFIGPASLPAELRNENNLRPQAVFLCNVASISAPATQELVNYVKSGGNLVIFPGPRTFADDWKANAAFWDLLPADLTDPPAEEKENTALAWQSTGFTHPVTAFWNDTAQGSLGAIKFWRHFGLKPRDARPAKPEDDITATSEARIVNRFVNNDPSVVEWSYGEGNVALFSSTSTPEWNNLPLHPAFVPYLQRLMGQFNRKNESRLVLSPGEAFRKPMGAEWKDKEFTVLSPGDTEPVPAGKITQDGTDFFLRYADTEKAGVYQIAVAGEPTAIFSVQMDPAESDLRKTDAAALEETLKPAPSAEGETAAAEVKITRELWTPVLWLVIALFLLEAFLAHRLTKARMASA